MEIQTLIVGCRMSDVGCKANSGLVFVSFRHPTSDIRPWDCTA
jgi:hypothetical protein